MKPISPFGLPIGISVSIWSLVGLLRLILNYLPFRKKRRWAWGRKLGPSDIAAVLPAHNEELVIRSSIQALTKMLDKKQIYVVSDGSKDKTYRRARMEGCHVSRLEPGRGKGRALVYLLTRYHLFDRYKLIFIVDADTRIDVTCVKRALPLFKDPDIGVCFASSRIRWPQHFIPRLKYYFIAYRERLNRLLQYFLIYGQTWKYTNVNYVIPGFATIYRSNVLKQLEIDTPGLLIEDFNLAFQFHKKKLGKIGYSPSLIGWDQYPDNLVDYWKQVRRWNIGFFQTVKKNGLWFSMFWLALATFTIEVFLNSIYILFLPFLLLFLIIPMLPVSNQILDMFSFLYRNFGPYQSLNLRDIFIGTYLIDYMFTVIIGLIGRKPQFIFYGLFFFFMHFATSLILLSSIIPGFFGRSSGRWTSPKRQTV